MTDKMLVIQLLLTNSLLTAFFMWTWVTHSSSVSFSTCYGKESLGIRGTGFFMGRMSFLSPNQQRQSTEGNTKHRPQPVAWPHPFFIHHPDIVLDSLFCQDSATNVKNNGRRLLTLSNGDVLGRHPPVDDHCRVVIDVQKRHLAVLLAQNEKHLSINSHH